MPDLVLHGKITEVRDNSFSVCLEDDNNRISTAYILKSDIIPEDQSSIVIGNTIEYIIDGPKETIHVTRLKIWTQQDQYSVNKLLDGLDNA